MRAISLFIVIWQTKIPQQDQNPIQAAWSNLKVSIRMKIAVFANWLYMIRYMPVAVTT